MKSWPKILEAVTPQDLLGFGFKVSLETKTKSLDV